MVTQIAPTPIVRGAEARKVIEEMKRQPSSESKLGERKLSDYFDKILNRK